MNKQTIYALGFFDGVHSAHAELLRQCRLLASARGCRAGVITFSSHPDALVFGSAPQLINSAADRERLLRGLCKMDTVVNLPFDRTLMTTPWQDFFRALLRDYHAAGLVCGHDFRFGDRGEGDCERLREACDAAKIPCVVVPEQRIDGICVSSTYIRRLIAAGDMEQAARFLGHPHILTGEVISGRQLGHTLGTPTANIAVAEGVLLPRFGVYACIALHGGARHIAVTNVGTRPTVGGTHATVEPWLLDYDGNLYGQTLTLAFYAFLRPEQKFASLEDLRTEIQKNAQECRDFFAKK